VKRNAKGAITAITHRNAAASIALASNDVMINGAHTVDKEVIDVEENRSWERLKGHSVLHVTYMANSTEAL